MSYHVKVHNEPRRQLFIETIGSDTVPVVSPIPELASLPRIGVCSVYMVDLEALSPEQRERVAACLAAGFGEPIDDVKRKMAEQGLPILAEQTTLYIHNVAVRHVAVAAMIQVGTKEPPPRVDPRWN